MLLVLDEGDLLTDGVEVDSLELECDFLLVRRKTFLIRFVVGCELEVESESESLELEVSDEDEEFNMSARMPGWDSSSIRCWGVLSYI